ncbi:uncharacterized protein BX663DRAFT_502435 [Cokeromyces recurvatus]|uniref:uncharacterized protein n=1 Tax=Cokeromyces recurvatus TaxID=90255 RepID=UPI00221EFF67|nr:uncharacterized protein BX663DRAFT_502435 [Cokeromyces recurvatus]KAI7905318.1 hypothetical protein BX663DRAFT_502435 [Cokeromyces recurvatus]
MDLSWCIMCDCRCIEDNLYCSESCRIKDINNQAYTTTIASSVNNSPVSTPPSSPLLDPFLSCFNHEKRTSITISKSIRSLQGSSFELF